MFILERLSDMLGWKWLERLAYGPIIPTRSVKRPTL